MDQCERSSIKRNTYFCGMSSEEASTMCTHPCPTSSSLECPNGETCFGVATCANSMKFSNKFLVDYSTGSCFKDAAPHQRFRPT